MKCNICGGIFQKKTVDLPFRLGYHSIVIIKTLPVLECENCSEYTIEDSVMEEIDGILESIDSSVELEILDFEKTREPNPAIP